MKEFCLGIIVAIGLTLPAFGQPVNKEQLVGAWTLVSCDATRSVPYCPPDPNPNGIFIFDASGIFASMAAARGRPKFTHNRLEASAEEYKAAAIGFVANFGTWSFNEADKTLTLHYEANLIPNIEGADGKYIVNRISSDELTFGVGDVWRRVK